MIFFRRKIQQRRLESRKSGPSLLVRFRAAGGVGAVLLGLCLFLVVLGMDSWPLEPLSYRQGQFLRQDLYARVEYEIESEDLTKKKREYEARQTPAVVRYDPAAATAVVDELRRLPAAIGTASQPAQLPQALRDRFGLSQPGQLAAFAQFASSDKAEDYAQQLDQLQQRLAGRLLVSKADFNKAYERPAQNVRVLSDGSSEEQPKARLLDNSNAAEVEKYARTAAGAMDAALQPVVQTYLVKALGQTVFYTYDPKETEAAEEAARAVVKPVMETRRRGDLLAQRNDEVGLLQPDMDRITAEHYAYLASLDRADRYWVWRELAGRAALHLGLVMLLGVYVVKYSSGLLADRRRAVSVAGVLVLVLLMAKIAIQWAGLNPYLAVFGVFLTAAALAIALGQRFALATSAILVMFVCLQCRLGLTSLLALWAASAATVFQLRDVRTRSKLIETGMITAVAAFAAVVAVDLAARTPLRFTLIDGGWAAGAAIAAGFFTQGVLPLIERLFGVATSMTLLEWCDANKPLLKRLALEAPGTYNHSLLLGVMCEAAAETIGANGLLARVGAYYHDVGKVNKPDYFVENQVGPLSMSRHARLSPAMSLLVIKGHVKDGLELADDYGLPRVLREFIASHHGTTLVEYFYKAAQEQARQEELRMPEEVEFRHAGPKPHTKESAILMLADASESSVRAMTEPTSGRIEAQIHKVIMARLMDGQLDECELTLREVREVENSLVKSLVGIYHGRLVYPSNKGPGYAPAAGGTGKT